MITDNIVNSIDEINHIACEQNWDIEYQTLKAGNFHAHMRATEVLGSLVSREIDQGPIQVIGANGDDAVSIFVVSTNGTASFLNSDSFAAEPKVYVATPGADLDFHSCLLTRVEALRVSIGQYETVLDRFNIGNSLAYGQVTPQAFNRELCENARIAIAGLLEPTDSPLSWKAEKIEHILELVVSNLSLLPDEKNQIHRKSRLFKKATDYIEEHLSGNIRISDISADLEIDIKTLQRLFKHRTGVTPGDYILAKRLFAARRLLENGKYQEVTVTDVANRAGFSHLGRFSISYRQLFNELPSETLKSKP